MSNLFTKQIEERAKADEAMRRTAEGLIDDAVKKAPSRDVLGRPRSNEEALKRILSLCGIDEGRLASIEGEDALFTPIETEKAWYRHQTGYCVGANAGGGFTALLPGGIRGYYYLDGNGRKHRVDSENAGRFTKVYCLCRLLPEGTLSIQDLLRYCLSFLQRKILHGYILISLAAGILGLAFPHLVSILLRGAESSGAAGRSSLPAIAILCVIAELVRLCLNTLLGAFESSFTNRVSHCVKNAALIRYLSDTSAENARRSASEVWNAINDTVPEFIENLLSSGMNLVPHLIFTVSYCAAAAFCLGKLSLGLYLVLLLFAIALWFVNKGFDRWYLRMLQMRIRGDHLLFQIFKGIEKIRSHRAQKRVFLQWAKVYAEEAYSDKVRKEYATASTAIHSFVTPLMMLVLICIAAFIPLTRSSLLTATLLAGLLAGEIAELTDLTGRVVNSRSMWQTISFLFEEPVREKKVKCTSFSPSLHVRRLSFTYPGMERLLDDISFDVEKGEYVGIVGLSGCGKSTLLKLLLGILTPSRGEISYGGYELSETDQRTILRNIGIVLQNESLIPGTIRQNLMMQPAPVTEEQIWKTLETVGIADLVRSYPYGLDTEIGVSGASMSGGQMQKLLIARAIISKPKMIVFDEATSALDNVSQKEIKDALDAMNCTRIVVAHRLSTVKDCDRIILLDKGKIAQEGTYDELVNREGLFRELVMCQSA